MRSTAFVRPKGSIALVALAILAVAPSSHAQEPCHFTSIDEGTPYCGLLTDGTVHCWGQVLPSDPPYAPGTGTFVQVSAGRAHGCGLRSDGTAECWGKTCDIYATPGGTPVTACYDFSGIRATPGGSFLDVESGGSRVCGRRPDSSIWCWGGNPDASFPEGSFTELGSGYAHACGITDAGDVECWGVDLLGSTAEPAPDVTPPIDTFSGLSTTWLHSCVLRAGAAECWGWNDDGQATPLAGTFTQLSTTMFNSCGLRPDGSVECWGKNDLGQLTPPAGPFVAIAGTCGLRMDGTAECWGGDAAFNGLVECATCGNGILADHEECDDSNLVDNDGCDSNCTLPACGNEIVNPGEECDDGDATTGSYYGCESDCTHAEHWCGDGFRDSVEECDDGNDVTNDGCEPDCSPSPPFCGNGVETEDEECDDANAIDNDGCDTNCQSSCPGAPGVFFCQPGSVSASLKLVDDTDDARDSLVWSWRGGPASAGGSPPGQSEYQLCFYPDGGPLGGAVRLRGSGSGGSYSPEERRYLDKKMENSAIRSMKFVRGFDADAKMQLKAKGVGLPEGLLPAASYTIELHERDSGDCWSSTFAEGSLTDHSFKARYKAP